MSPHPRFAVAVIALALALQAVELSPPPAGSPTDSATRQEQAPSPAAGGAVGGAGGANTPSVGRVRFLKDIAPDDASSNPGHFAQVGAKVFFAADDGDHGKELWTSDGTRSGTHMVSNIRPGGSSSPWGLTAHRGKLYFTADDGEHGREPWVSDGTRAGTRMLKDIRVGREASISLYDNGGLLTLDRAFHILGDRLLFRVDDGEHGQEVWRTNGTRSGTRIVEEIVPNALVSLDAVTDGRLYFHSEGSSVSTLWSTDGTVNGTHRIHSGNCAPTLATFESKLFFTDCGEPLVISEDGEPNLRRQEVWRTTGTSASKRKITTFSLPDDSPRSLGIELFRSRDHLLFSVEKNDPRYIYTSEWDDVRPARPNKYRYYRSDGTVGSRTLIYTVAADPDRGDFVAMVFARTVGNRLFLGFATGPWNQWDTHDLWVVRTRSGASTHLRTLPGGWFREIGSAGGLMYFGSQAKDHHYYLWRTDGTADGTRRLARSGSDQKEFAAAGGRAFFVGRGGGLELWTTDGSKDGTEMVKDINDGGGSSNPWGLTVARGRLWFFACGDTTGCEPWTVNLD